MTQVGLAACVLLILFLSPQIDHQVHGGLIQVWFDHTKPQVLYIDAHIWLSMIVLRVTSTQL